MFLLLDFGIYYQKFKVSLVIPKENKIDIVAMKLLMAQFMVSIMYVFFQDEIEYHKRQMKRLVFMQQMQLMTNTFYKKVLSNSRIKKRRIKKRWWVKERSLDWWNRIVLKHFTEEDWLANFRMSSSTFKYICERLRPYLSAAKNWVRKPLSVEKKVAISLYKLASCAEYRVVANQFGTHKCVVHKCLYDFCNAVNHEFSKEVLNMPNEFEAQEIAASFEEICGIPNIIGAIDGTHIPILPPTDGYSDFINRKGWTSYNVLAIVDNLYRFRYATCQHPGSTHDAKVLKDSYLFKNYHQLIPKGFKNVNGQNIPFVIIGDPAYPLLSWLLKGYKGRVTAEEESFNTYMNRGRVVVENAFGRLKARFRCLLKRLDINYKFTPKVVITCLILHNIIEQRKDIFIQNWLEAVQEADIIFPQPNILTTREFDDLDGGIIRDTLKNYMTKFPLKKSNF